MSSLISVIPQGSSTPRGSSLLAQWGHPLHVVVSVHCPAAGRCLGARWVVQTGHCVIQKHPGAWEELSTQLVTENKVAEKLLSAERWLSQVAPDQ